ncbi:hypothetical protein Tco_0109713 [Tanacetum coccineum]
MMRFLGAIGQKVVEVWLDLSCSDVQDHFWTSAKVKTVNRERQIQALVDKKKEKSRRKQRKDSGPTEPIPDEAINKDHVAIISCDPPQSGKDRMQLTKLMDLCTQLQSRVLALETTKSNQALEIESLKRRVKRGASNTGEKKLLNLDADAEVEVTVVDEIKDVATTTKSIPVSTAEVVTTASASVVISDELNLAQTLIEIKTAKPKPVTTAATTVTSVRPRAMGIIFHDQEEQVPASTKTFSSLQSQLPQVKDKGKGKMVEPKVPLNKKDQVALDEEMARNLEAQLQAELIEEERLTRQKEEEANIALIES